MIDNQHGAGCFQRWTITAMVLLFLLRVSAAERPNIIMFFTDDQRADAVGYAGNKVIRTPNLDRLAKSGVIFRNCFVNTSICCVSRANLVMGQYPEQHGVKDFDRPLMTDQLKNSIPGRLRKAGYQTAFFGKWGIGAKVNDYRKGAAVFDYWAGQPKQTNYFHKSDCRYVKWDGWKRPLNDLCDCPADARGRRGPDVRIGKKNLKDPIHVDAVITPMHVNRFLGGRDKKKPFLMLVFFKSPHGPFQDFDPETEGYTKGLTMPRSKAATMENAKREPEVVKKSLGWKSGQHMLKDPKVMDRHMRDYYRSISSMDLGVGRIMKALNKHRLAENTVILFTSDNGHFMGEHGSGGKWLMYEDSLRVPGFIFDPRAPTGKSTERLVITTDFSATMLALAGQDIPASVSGRDLMALHKEPKADWRHDFYYTHPYGHKGRIARTIGVRNERYVYTRYIDPKPNYEQLFDLKTDPDQLKNLATSRGPLLKQFQVRCNAMKTELGGDKPSQPSPRARPRRRVRSSQ